MNTQQLVLPEDLKNIQPFMRWAEFPVKTEADQELAVAAMAEIKGRIKDIEKKQKELFGPLKKAIRDFEERVKNSYLQPLKVLNATLNDRILRFWKAREERLEKEAREAHDRKLEEEKTALANSTVLATSTGNEDAMNEMLQRKKNVAKLEKTEPTVSQTVRTNAATLAQKKVWAWRITDEDKVPRSWMMIDEKKLNQELRNIAKSGTALQIPGIEFFQETRTSLRV